MINSKLKAYLNFYWMENPLSQPRLYRSLRSNKDNASTHEMSWVSSPDRQIEFGGELICRPKRESKKYIMTNKWRDENVTRELFHLIRREYDSIIVNNIIKDTSECGMIKQKQWLKEIRKEWGRFNQNKFESCTQSSEAESVFLCKILDDCEKTQRTN